ncbi:MAG: hypothetical protein Q7T81_09540 [Pseudolabrys sp.]|nr:hypothetical protein [Pseudolabrys sp.]
MRTKKPGGGWREEVFGTVFELYLGISRLMAALQDGPPRPPRKKRPPRR